MSIELETKLLKRSLENLLKKEVDLIIKDNRTTFLSARQIQNGKLRINLHKAFLKAPYHILLSLREYLIDNRSSKEGIRDIKNYMEIYFQNNDYSSHLNIHKINPQGKTYNLKDMFDEINKKYFHDSLDKLNITWFKNKKRRKGKSITFGSYDHGLKLIKVNQMLDEVAFPIYFVRFVVFHEILHYIYPVLIDENGRRKVHYKEFKKAEAGYEDFDRAMLFEKQFLKKR